MTFFTNMWVHIQSIFVIFAYGHTYLHVLYFSCKVEKDFLYLPHFKKGGTLCQNKRKIPILDKQTLGAKQVLNNFQKRLKTFVSAFQKVRKPL